MTDGYKTLKRIKATPMKDFTGEKEIPEDQLPSAILSLLAALMPVILIGLSEVFSQILDRSGAAFGVVRGMGNPVIAMLLSLLFALFTLSLRRGNKMTDVMNDLAHSIGSIAMILLIIAGAGAQRDQ